MAKKETRTLLVIPPDAHVPTDFTLTAADAAVALKTEALDAMEGVIAVESEEDVKTAVAVVSVAKGLSKEMENYRTAMGKPFRAFADRLKEVADEYREDLDKEVTRVERMLSDFEARKRREREEARQRELAEVARVQREAAEANRRAEAAAAAEQAAREAQAAAERAAQEAKGRKAREAAEQAAKEAQAAAEAAARETAAAQEAAMDASNSADDRMTEAVTSAAFSGSTTTAGMRVRNPITFEVTDELALFAYMPSAFKLTLLKTPVLDALARGVRDIPGIRIIEGPDARVKPAPPTGVLALHS